MCPTNGAAWGFALYSLLMEVGSVVFTFNGSREYWEFFRGMGCWIVAHGGVVSRSYIVLWHQL